MASLTEILIAVGSLIVATIAAVVGIKSYINTKITTAIATDDHKQRNSPINPYLIDGFSWRQEKSKRQCFFAISLTNTSTTPTSVVKAELHLKLFTKEGHTSQIILQPETLPLPGSTDISTAIQPINLAAGSTASIWLSYDIPAYVTEKLKIDTYEIVLTSGSGFRVSVHQYIMKEIENAKGTCPR